MTEQELMYASDEDITIYHRATKGLPGVEGFSGTGFDADGVQIPYGVGPHSVKCFREIIEIVKPTNILEIGFNLGYSSALWLHMSEASVVSIDISNKAETLKAASMLGSEFIERFTFVISDSAEKNLAGDLIRHSKFDMIFIDGGHLEHHVVNDIGLALSLGIKYLAFDDVMPQFGPGVMPAIAQFPQLKLVKELGNIALYENTSI